MDSKYVDYEAVNEGARVFVASADTSAGAFVTAVHHAIATIGVNAIFHGGHTDFDGDKWVATVTAA